MGSNDPLKISVECYAGHKADERPIRFAIKDHTYEIQDIIDRWYDPQDTYFKVLADDGNHYILRHCHRGQEEYWALEAYRKV